MAETNSYARTHSGSPVTAVVPCYQPDELKKTPHVHQYAAWSKMKSTSLEVVDKNPLGPNPIE